MNTVLLIDKSKGITSFDVIRILRKKLGVRKMGHAGTLDPLATGLLIVGVGEATKELSKYMGLPKEYEVTIEFGKVSNTYDANGKFHIPHSTPVRRSFSEGGFHIPRDQFQEALKNFIGTIEQTPPPFSAVKIGGKRAYELARKGISVTLAPRNVQIFNIEILAWNWPLVKLRVTCGKGTYMRSLAHDLGQVLGCGGYVKELRRTAIGEFRVEEAEKI